MPWKTITPMDEITRFVLLAQTDQCHVSDLCEQFGISRKTGYKHLERYALEGAAVRGQAENCNKNPEQNEP